ncbi:hypothetical protein CALCODRAFT_430333 [Calocera cornea HHB12733]|uniref:Integrase core domain-containing protein n=1 Tax=Calocera cornea HHB12733 TaxID=1353952 RepID=A0A165HYI2_9BASI|nr:hypothetical protein CALCODRAFT_430333 [Calocera cornea HHB12733]
MTSIICRSRELHLYGHCPGYSLRARRTTLYRWLDRLKLGTPRKPVHSDTEVGEAIVRLLQEDVLHRWGAARVKVKLQMSGVTDARRGFVRDFMRTGDEYHVTGRTPGKKQIHKTSLWSIGVSEEWSGDGFEKLQRVAGGLPCWGLRDKASRRFLGLWVLPNVRLGVVPPALYLRAARKAGGVPLRLVLDKGTETIQVGALAKALSRLAYAPNIDPEVLPPFLQIKSIYNITIERSWRGLFNDELEAIALVWDAGIRAGICRPHIQLEYFLARWVWARTVQCKLDQYVAERNSSKIRQQTRSHLPCGLSPNEIWFNPQEHHLDNCLIPVPAHILDDLIEQYTPPKLFQFVPDDVDHFASRVYLALGEPILNVNTAWDVYERLMARAEHDAC